MHALHTVALEQVVQPLLQAVHTSLLTKYEVGHEATQKKGLLLPNYFLPVAQVVQRFAAPEHAVQSALQGKQVAPESGVHSLAAQTSPLQVDAVEVTCLFYPVAQTTQ